MKKISFTHRRALRSHKSHKREVPHLKSKMDTEHLHNKQQNYAAHQNHRIMREHCNITPKHFILHHRR